jgi:hypothetical protein
MYAHLRAAIPLNGLWETVVTVDYRADNRENDNADNHVNDDSHYDHLSSVLSWRE